MEVRAPVSVGELLDKISILDIKAQRIQDPDKLKNVEHERDLLNQEWRRVGPAPGEDPEVDRLRAELAQVNEELWEIEDAIRDKEREGVFDEEFIELARSVYLTNDRRAQLKKDLNLRMGSDLVEEKSYAPYSPSS